MDHPITQTTVSSKKTQLFVTHKIMKDVDIHREQSGLVIIIIRITNQSVTDQTALHKHL